MSIPIPTLQAINLSATDLMIASLVQQGWSHQRDFLSPELAHASMVLYLNQDWLPEQGGALRLYPDGGSRQDILPLGGSLALFMSADMPHEVLVATRERVSLA
ncbi:MAG: 2OG-Fe(II) oxygenase, partial [Glaciimonas sp.]|nr:2OG-Fe(II) oxygenase [Glaciimonas sp.]